MNNLPYQKIAIIGNAGSGKTTLALQLHKKLNLPLYHLDQFYWLPGWQREDYAKFQEIHSELCDKDAWIIEGSYLRLLYARVMHADVIIFLDMPRYLCLWRILKRAVGNWGLVVVGNSPDCRQTIFSRKFLEFVRWVWNFNGRYRQITLDMLKEFRDEKQIYVLRSQEEVKDFVINLDKNN